VPRLESLTSVSGISRPVDPVSTIADTVDPPPTEMLMIGFPY